MAKEDLIELLSQLDDDTRARWRRVLEAVDAEIEEHGPAAVRAHLEKALEHLLAIGWALHRCYAVDEAGPVMGSLGEAACTVEELRNALDLIQRKPEWSQ